METNRKILVAEDEKALALALQLKMKKEGIDADIVHNGKELLDALSSKSYNLILMDLVMPQMDGFKVLEDLQKNGNTIPIIVTSNLSQEEDKNRALAFGAAEYLIKSNTPIIEVIQHVKAVLEKNTQ